MKKANSKTKRQKVKPKKQNLQKQKGKKQTAKRFQNRGAGEVALGEPGHGQRQPSIDLACQRAHA